MNKLLLTCLTAAGIAMVSSQAMALDISSIRQCRGCDDPAGHIRQSRGLDDVGGARGLHADGHISGRDRVRAPGDVRGRDRVRAPGDVRGRDRVRTLGTGGASSSGLGAVGTTNPAGHVRGRGADDVGGARGLHADGHISGRDRVRTMSSIAAGGLLGR